MVEVYEKLIGKTLATVTGAEQGSDDMTLRTAEGDGVRFYHRSDCCESVDIVEVIGDVQDLIGSPLVTAEEVSSDGHPDPDTSESFTWTFYRFATAKGSVVVRWLGRSNGYYSESVTVEEVQ